MDPLTAAQIGLPIAGGILGGLFGNEGNVDRSPYLQEGMKDLGHTARALTNRQYGGYTPIQGNLGVGGGQTRGLGMAMSEAQQAGPLADFAQQAWQDQLGAENPYLEQLLGIQQDQAGQFMREQMMPQIMANTGSGGLGFSKMPMLAAERAQQQLLQQQGKTLYDTYGQSLANKQRMLSLAPQMTTLGMQAPMQLGNMESQNAQINALNQQGRLNEAAGQRANAQHQMQMDWNPLLNESTVHGRLAGNVGTVPQQQTFGPAQGAGLGFAGAQIMQNMWGGGQGGGTPNLWADTASTVNANPYGQALAGQGGTPQQFMNMGSFGFGGF